MRKLLTILNANAKKSDGVATGGGAAWLNLKTVAETFYWCSKRRAARMSLLCRWHTTRMDRLCRANTYFINKAVLSFSSRVLPRTASYCVLLYRRGRKS